MLLYAVVLVVESRVAESEVKYPTRTPDFNFPKFPTPSFQNFRLRLPTPTAQKFPTSTP